jgi:pimeloyl-ACP methyl ester carboxylesterase
MGIALHDLGGSGNEPLLVSHATGFCARVYEPLARLLGERFHVWGLDYRSHGDAPKSDDLHWHRIADDLEEAVDRLGAAGPIGVFGHSMGAACALLVEARSPGTFRWAYLYEPIVYPNAPGERLADIVESTRRRRAAFASRGDAMHRFAGRPPLDTVRADSLLAYVDHALGDAPDGVTLKCRPEHEAAVFGGSGQISVDDVRDAALPVVVACGGPHSHISQFADVQVAALPHGRIERFDHLGHLGPMEDPVSIARGILAFTTQSG